MYENVKITVVQNSDLIAKLDACGANFFGKPGMRPSYCPPTFVVVSGLAEGGEVSPSMYCNGACIVENMSLAATELGLGHVYIMGMLNAIRKDEALNKELGIPEGFVILSALSVGKSAEPQQPRILTTKKIQMQIIR